MRGIHPRIRGIWLKRHAASNHAKLPTLRKAIEILPRLQRNGSTDCRPFKMVIQASCAQSRHGATFGLASGHLTSQSALMSVHVCRKKNFPVLLLAAELLIALALPLRLTAAPAAPAGHAPSSTNAADVAAALAAGRALALIEVTSVKEVDSRPSDGNLVDVVKFKVVKSSGQMPSQITITKDFGGRRIGPPPKPAGVLYPNPLENGKRYWIIFNEDDFQKFQQGVVAWWPENDAPAELETALKDGKFGKQ
jgi:hypothetical protein